MKSKYFLLGFIAIALSLSSCKTDSGENVENQNSDGTEISNKDYSDFVEFDLRPYELKASLMVPKEDRTLIKHELDTYTWDLIKGKQTFLKIQDWGMIDGFKRYLEELDKQSEKVEFIEKEKNFTVYKLTKGTSKVTYHTAAQHEIDGINYIFESSDQGLSEEGVKDAIVAVKSVEAIINE
ncbi:hypothetical protein [Brumimicrobium mesophilum]|uniref:hypothetical protein n=1 Tax=Brumimicrobium mesophilum TaxID=392717 RepID=UPI000D140C34|nr:hypothetical protein [Brumimicrobium mesophilum]